MKRFTLFAILSGWGCVTVNNPPAPATATDAGNTSAPSPSPATADGGQDADAGESGLTYFAICNQSQSADGITLGAGQVPFYVRVWTGTVVGTETPTISVTMKPFNAQTPAVFTLDGTVDDWIPPARATGTIEGSYEGFSIGLGPVRSPRWGTNVPNGTLRGYHQAPESFCAFLDSSPQHTAAVCNFSRADEGGVVPNVKPLTNCLPNGF